MSEWECIPIAIGDLAKTEACFCTTDLCNTKENADAVTSTTPSPTPTVGGGVGVFRSGWGQSLIMLMIVNFF